MAECQIAYKAFGEASTWQELFVAGQKGIVCDTPSQNSKSYPVDIARQLPAINYLAIYTWYKQYLCLI